MENHVSVISSNDIHTKKMAMFLLIDSFFHVYVRLVRSKTRCTAPTTFDRPTPLPPSLVVSLIAIEVVNYKNMKHC
jgi:hypothetical protein